MHTLHTTDAFILNSQPHGESNRVYKLFTRELGLLYAHGQGVRELKNRNRYALASRAQVSVTLVRGREVWRITGARETDAAALRRDVGRARIMALLNALLPVEDRQQTLFDLVAESIRACDAADPVHARAAELLTALRIVHELGYIDRTDPMLTPYLSDRILSETLLERAERDRRALIHVVNAALREAT